MFDFDPWDPGYSAYEPGVVGGGVGSASLTLYERHVTDAERKAWRLEDAERDARRIPCGFRAPISE